MSLRALVRSAAVLALASCAGGGDGMRESPRMDAPPVNQLVVSGNACGPAALLTSFRCGSEPWRELYDSAAGDDERGKIRGVIRDIGMRPSRNVPGRARWSRRGVSVADLRDMANEMAVAIDQPYITDDAFFLRRGEDPPALLRRVHRRIERSLARGFPPVLSVRRYATSGGAWRAVDAHFVTVLAVPRSLPRDSTSFSVTYADPWGGRRCEGRIGIPDSPLLADGKGLSTCLEASFPASEVGRKRVKSGERSALAVSAALGRW